MQPTAKPNSNNKVSYKYDLRKHMCTLFATRKSCARSQRKTNWFKFRKCVSKENKTEY